MFMIVLGGMDMKEKENRSFGLVLCLLLGILIGSLGTYYVLSTNYTNELNQTKKELNQKEEELEKLQNQQQEEEEETLKEITSDEIKRTYNEVLNGEMKPVLIYLNQKSTTYENRSFTDKERKEATCYYVKDREEEDLFVNKEEKESTILKEKFNPFVVELFGEAIESEEEEITCQYDLEKTDALYKVTKVIEDTEKEQIELTYDELNIEKLEEVGESDQLDYEQSDVVDQYQIVLKKVEDHYQIISNKKI